MTAPGNYQFNIRDEDRALLKRAGDYPQFGLLSDLSPESLQAIAQRQGVDLATAVLFDRIQNSPRHAGSLENVKAPVNEPLGPSEIVVIPGAFHRHHAHSGADGQRVIELAKALGWKAHRVPVGSFSPTGVNARDIRDFINGLKADRIIIVSLSKGGLDVKTMFEQTDLASFAGRIVGWISLSGMVSGTPLVDWLEARPIRSLGVKALLRLRGQSFETVRELRRPTKPKPWPPVPAGMKTVHVIGFPLRRHLSHKWAARGYSRLLSLGPNDGGGILLADVLDWPGAIYPVWGADHYLQPRWDITPLLRNILIQSV